jgi:hypothetical protein
MSNVIYVYQWQGIRTKWNYQLEIIPSDDSELTSPTIIQLPEGFIKNLEFNFAYDKYPIGFPEAPTLSLTIDFKRINNADTQYNELKRAIFNPIVFTNVGTAVQIKVKLGTIVNLKIQFPETNDFVKIFCGIYRAESKVKYNILTAECSFDAIAVEKTVLESFNFNPIQQISEILDRFNENKYIPTYTLYELIIKNNPPNPPPKLVTHFDKNHRFLLRPFSFLMEQIQEIATLIAKKILRSQSASINLPQLPNIEFYKQKYTGDGSLGNQPSAIYYVERIERLVNPNPETYALVGGLLAPNDEKSLMTIYKNSVWDFLRDYCEWQLAKGIITQNLVLFSYILGDEQNYIEIKKDYITNAEVELFSKLPKTITASNFEYHSDENYSDIEKIESAIEGTYNEEEITIPITFSNIPACVDYQIQKSPYAINAISFFPHYHNLYYSEIDSLYEGDSPYERFIRIHEYCNFPIKSNLTSSALPGCEFQPFNFNQLNFENKIRDMIAASQVETGIPVLVTKILNAIFTNPNQTYISELTVPIDHVTSFSSGNLWYFNSKIPWLIPWTNIKLNLNDLNNFITIPFQYWSVISSKVDFKDETVTFELLSINV